MAPGLLYFILFKYVPMYGIQIAFKEYYPWNGIWKSPWVGMDNVNMLFANGVFWRLLKNTLAISSLKLAFGFAIPIIFALMLNELTSRWFKRFSQTVTYMPHFLSWIIIYGIVFGLLSENFGVINRWIAEFGHEKIAFLVDKDLFRPLLVATSIWKETGWNSIIYLAAISSIDPELYESAKVDGASRWKQTIHITLPQLMPTAAILLLLAIGRILYEDFEQILMFLGNKDNAYLLEIGDVFETHVYSEGIRAGRFSYATAVGMFQSVIGMVLVIVSNWAAKKKFGYRGLW